MGDQEDVIQKILDFYRIVKHVLVSFDGFIAVISYFTFLAQFSLFL